jgi:lambda repressor-like predicted transcriptional regulator
MTRCTKYALQDRTTCGPGFRCTTPTTPSMGRPCFHNRLIMIDSLGSSLRQSGTTLLRHRWNVWGVGRLESRGEVVVHQISSSGVYCVLAFRGVSLRVSQNSSLDNKALCQRLAQDMFLVAQALHRYCKLIWPVRYLKDCNMIAKTN